LSPVLVWTQIAERLMGTTLVGEADPLTDGRSRVRERGEVVLPDALVGDNLKGIKDSRVVPT